MKNYSLPYWFFPFLNAVHMMLFYELCRLSLEAFLALEAAKMDSFAFVGDFKFCCFFV
jgi:hypothetical protein